MSNLETMQTNDNSSLFTPFNQIYVSLSGGGFRAACFGLGCLSFLESCKLTGEKEVNLLERVKFISSASGGSFVSILYTIYLYQNKSFKEAYDTLKDFMHGNDLLSKALETLNDDNKWKSKADKERNLINAFSLVYDSLFKSATLEILSNSDENHHISQICVNATEFVTGLSFRFINADALARKGLIGNHYLHLNSTQRHIINKIKLADIMAASSCFPGVFEPLIFPRDFTYKHDSVTKMELSADELLQTIMYIDPNLRQQELAFSSDKFLRKNYNEKIQEFALMDGGINDNQGINGSLLAVGRLETINEDSNNIIIICDASKASIEGFFPKKVDKDKGIKLSIFKIIILFFTIVGFVPLGISLLFIKNIIVKTSLITISMTTILFISTLAFTIFYFVRFKKKTGVFDQVIKEFINLLLFTKLKILVEIIKVRYESLKTLNTDVFMSNIRRLQYEKLYKGLDINNHRIINQIYSLSSSRYLPPNSIFFTARRRQMKMELPAPSEIMLRTAEFATEVPTSLWFDPEDKENRTRDSIIATGQFTMCYNLLLYIEQIEAKSMSSAVEYEISSLKESLLVAWDEFKKDPLWMV